jgi:transcriptional regulator with XRE-family HTH domain
MRLDVTAIRDHCRRSGTNVSGLLRKAGVSRNAFYSLARRDSLVPRSLKAIADSLGVPVTSLLADAGAPAARMQDLLREAGRIARSHPAADRDNIRHTLLLLDERPVERLRRALRRARTFDFR